MAGIGFRLQSLVKEGSILGATTAYFSGTIIAAGPWLSGVAALLILRGTASSYLSEADHSLLLATIVTVFAVSFIVAGGPQMLVTRYVADRLYLKDTTSIVSTSIGVLCFLVLFAFISLPFLLFAPFPLLYRLLVTTLFLITSMIFSIMIFLSSVHRYIHIVLIFIFSYAIGILTSLALGPRYHLLGSLGGFTMGQLLCLSLLLVLIYLEFPSSNGVSFAYLGYLRKYWNLLIIGLFYAMSVWVDNLVFWLSPHSQVVAGFYHLFPPYDTAKFIAALSTIPAAVLFVIHIETNFDRHYQSFCNSILERRTLSDMVHAREGMREAVSKGIGLLLKIQGLFAIFLCLIASDIAAFVSLNTTWVPLICMSILAGVCQFFVFVAMLLLLYIDQRGTAMLLIGFFILANVLLTVFTLYLGPAFYGAGNLIASSIGAILGMFLFNYRLKRLECLTFMNQPMV